MNTINDEVTIALNQRADAVRVEDNLEAILDGRTVVRFTPPDERPNRRPILLTAAAGLLVVGAGGLLWATQTEPPPSAASETPAPTSAPQTPASDAPIPDVSDAVHLQLDSDGWELIFADRDRYASNYSPTSRTTDDPDAVPVLPSIHFTTTANPSTSLLDDLTPSADVQIAGITTALYSNAEESLHVAQVQLANGDTTEVIVENASLVDATTYLGDISMMTDLEWQSAVDAAHSGPTTTIVGVGPEE